LRSSARPSGRWRRIGRLATIVVMTDRPADAASADDKTAAASAGDDTSLRSAAADIGKAIGWWSLFTAVVTKGIFAVIQSHFQDEFTFLQFFWLTLPLAAAVAILAYRVFAKLEISLAMIVGTVFGTLAVSVLTGVSSGSRVASAIFKPQNTDGTPVLFVKILWEYVKIYSLIGVAQAIFCGVVFGYGVYRLGRVKRRIPMQPR
jgi:hypothetical protein